MHINFVVMGNSKEKQQGELQLFSFANSDRDVQIRVKMLEDEPWFVAKDVCNVLGLVNSRKATMSLDEDEKRGLLIVTPSGTQTMTSISESGLYSLIFQSRKPEAKAFRKWVTSEVLPTLRKTGRYSVCETSAKQNYEKNFGQFLDLRGEVYRTELLMGREVRIVRYEDMEYYSLGDVLRAIGSETSCWQAAKSLNVQKKQAVKIFLFGQTHPAWFITRTGLRLIVSGSRVVKTPEKEKLGHFIRKGASYGYRITE